VLKKIEIKVTHPNCWATPLTKKYPGLWLESGGGYKFGGVIWINFAVKGRNPEILKKFVQNLSEEFKKPEILDFNLVHSQKNCLNMFTMVEATSSFYEIVLKNEVIPIGAKIVNGEEYWTLFTRKDCLSKVLQRISDKSLKIDDYKFEIESITNLTSFKSGMLSGSFEDVINELTLRQKEILIKAYLEGYYRWPRGKTVREIAKDLEISKVTCLHHLRNAEIKILEAFIKEMMEKERFLNNIN
jgi:predicted DNA binding protein